MTEEIARAEARKTACEHGVPINVTFNPYGEEPQGENFSYHPESAQQIFWYEEVVVTILPDWEDEDFGYNPLAHLFE